MPSVRISLSFGKLPDGNLEAFASGVVQNMTGNTAFPTPLVSMADLTAGITAFHDALGATAQGGTQTTAYKNQMRASLLSLLRNEAYYVQTACGGDLATLLSSGFQNTSDNRARSPLSQPVILLLTNPMSGQLGVKIGALPNAYGYEVRFKSPVGEWLSAGTFTSTRGVVINGLTAGIVYTVQVRAIGGSTGYSDWSDT